MTLSITDCSAYTINHQGNVKSTMMDVYTGIFSYSLSYVIYHDCRTLSGQFLKAFIIHVCNLILNVRNATEKEKLYTTNQTFHVYLLIKKNKETKKQTKNKSPKKEHTKAHPKKSKKVKKKTITNKNIEKEYSITSNTKHNITMIGNKRRTQEVVGRNCF